MARHAGRMLTLAAGLGAVFAAGAQRNAVESPREKAAATATAAVARFGEPPESVPWKKDTERDVVAAVQGRFVAIGGEFGATTTACVSCHGLDGTGDRSGAFPRIVQQSEWYLGRALADFASGERPSDVMTPIAAELTRDDRRYVAAYYTAAVPADAGPTVDNLSQTVLEQGRQLAMVGEPQHGILPCVACHGGEDQPAQPQYPYLAGQYASYLERQLILFKEGRRGGEQAAVMRPIAQSLSAEQMAAVVQYYASLPPGRAAPGPTGENQASDTQPRHDAAAERKAGASRAVRRLRVGATVDPQLNEGDEVLPTYQR